MFGQFFGMGVICIFGIIMAIPKQRLGTGNANNRKEKEMRPISFSVTDCASSWDVSVKV